jgi:GGDEF domain-containing protein
VAEPVEVDGAGFRVSVIIGMTFARAGDDPETALRDADRAMYRAKVRGKGRHEEFGGTVPRPTGTAV